MKKSHYPNCIALKICLWHNFEMAKFPLYALSGYNKALGIFYKLFVAGKAMGIIMKKYLIPPRLNEKFTVFGLTIFEWAAFIITLLIAILSFKFFMLAIPAAIFGTRIRFIDGDMNIWDYGKKLYRYFFKPQSYGIMGE